MPSKRVKFTRDDVILLAGEFSNSTPISRSEFYSSMDEDFLDAIGVYKSMTEALPEDVLVLLNEDDRLDAVAGLIGEVNDKYPELPFGRLDDFREIPAKRVIPHMVSALERPIRMSNELASAARQGEGGMDLAMEALSFARNTFDYTKLAYGVNGYVSEQTDDLILVEPQPIYSKNRFIRYLEALRKELAGCMPPRRKFCIGDTVDVKSGEHEGMSGKVLEIRDDSLYVVDLNGFGIELPTRRLEMATAGHYSRLRERHGGSAKAVNWLISSAVISGLAHATIYQDLKALAPRGRERQAAEALVGEKLAKVLNSGSYYMNATAELVLRELVSRGVFSLLGTDQYEVDDKKLERMWRRHFKRTASASPRALRGMGIDADAFEEGRTYVYTPDPAQEIGADETRLDPYAIGEEFLQDLIEVVPRYAANSRHGEALDMARQIILEKELPEARGFIRALSKPNKAFFSALRKAFDANARGRGDPGKCREFNTCDTEKARERVRSGSVSDRFIASMGRYGLYLAYRDVAVSEILDIVASAGKKHRKAYDAFSTFWERFKPREYDLERARFEGRHMTLRGEYPLKVTSGDDLWDAVEMSKSCLRGEDISAFREDRGTVHLVSYDKHRRPEGYVRLFIMETARGEPALALDTLEIAGKCFPQHEDSVRAMGLAAVQLGLDVGVKYVLGEDARVKYGPRQAFGNKTMKARLRKRGKNLFNSRFYVNGIHVGDNRLGGIGDFDDGERYCYSFVYGPDGNWKGECYVLFQNWRHGL